MQYNKDKYVIEIFSSVPLNIRRKYDLNEKNNRYGKYYVAELNRTDKRKLIWYCRLKRKKFRCYNKKWDRSTNYRQVFFKAYPAPYHCRYCGKKITPKKMVIDHLIPVNQVKKRKTARFLLEIRGIHNVNDIRNLYPSCVRCNLVKSDKLGLWFIRGLLGYRTIKGICTFSFFLLLIAVVVKGMQVLY